MKSIKKINNLISKYTKYTFATNLFMFIVKIVLFLLTKSFSFLIYSFYTLCIGLTKKNIFFNKKGKYTIVGILLLISSFLFINYSIFVMKAHYIANYSMYVGIAIAAVTFYDIILAIYGIVKAHKNNDKQSKVYKLTNLATAIISLELTQTAILSFTNVGTDLSFYNGMGGIVFGIASLIISAIVISIGIKDN